MKTILLTLSLMVFAGVSFANPDTGEVNDKSCECQTCLANGVCKETHSNGDRYIPDKSSTKPKKGKKGSSGAVKS